jgi:hypothetical protein
MKQRTQSLFFYAGDKTMKTDKKVVNQYSNGTCPDMENLEKYVYANMVLVEMEDIKEHVQVCQVCWMTVQSIAGSIAKKHLAVVPDVRCCGACGSTEPLIEGDAVSPGYDGYAICPDCGAV